MKKFGAFLLVIGFVLLLCASASADGFYRCGGYMVKIGDLKFQVLQKCGPPEMREFVGNSAERQTYRRGRTRSYNYDMPVEQWIYGPDRDLWHVITFKGGKVYNIESIIQR
jgi:hypothetical protein